MWETVVRDKLLQRNVWEISQFHCALTISRQNQNLTNITVTRAQNIDQVRLRKTGNVWEKLNWNYLTKGLDEQLSFKYQVDISQILESAS